MGEQAAASRLDERYGRSPRRGKRTWWIAGGALGAALLAVAWYVWAGPLTAPVATSSAQGTVSASSSSDAHHMSVTFTVRAPAGRAVACAIDAQTEDFATVGWKVLEFPPSNKTSRTFTHELRTTQQAEAGFVDSCWLT